MVYCAKRFVILILVRYINCFAQNWRLSVARFQEEDMFNLTIPFPAWDGIFQINEICDELRRNEIFRGIPVHRTPRRITMKAGSAMEGFDDVQVVEYGFTNGCYVTATLGGQHDDHYGTGWKLVALTLRWKDCVLGLPMADEKISFQMNTNQLKAVGLASYLRSHLRDYEGQSDFEQAKAKAHLVEAEATSDTIIAGLADPILAAVKRHKEWCKENSGEIDLAAAVCGGGDELIEDSLLPPVYPK